MNKSLNFFLLLCCSLSAITACDDGGGATSLCGDGLMDGSEACDDGNLISGDGCSDICDVEVAGICGDGALNIGEECDDNNTNSGDGCSANCEEELVEITCAELPALSSGSCEVTSGDARTALVGDVLAPEGIFRGGTVLVDAQGVISCVGCDCETTGATVVRCPQGVISPGLINSHDHITFAQNDPYTRDDERYEHRHDWRKGRRGHTKISASGSASQDQMRWHELRFLIGGATSIVGSGSASGFLRNLDRSAQEGLGQPQVQYDTFPLGDSAGTLNDSSCSYPSPITMADIANEEAYFPHIAEGIDDEARNEFVCTSNNENGANDLVEMQSAFIHGVGLTALDYQLMADAQTKLIWSPRSNITLYGETARVTTADRLGVVIALGTDWMPTGSMNMQRELACADSFNTENLGGYFTDADLWRMATENGAIASATNDVIGVLAQGKIADIAIFDGSVNRDYRAVIDAAAQDTLMVMRGGEVLYGESSVVTALGTGSCDTIDVCGSDRLLCADNDIGKSYSALKAANSGIYPDFFCGLPSNEPSCVPSRSVSVDQGTIYTGISSSDDSDGDGIVDTSDLCPNAFDPIRPLDSGVQADQDDDGMGDSCDPCPLDANTTECAVFDPTDADGDGISGSNDNCPSTSNADQADADSDNIGDVCDACPMFANTGGLACRSTIYDVKDGSASGDVSVLDVLVTACVESTGVFVQTIVGDDDYIAVENSAVFVYDPTTTCGVNIDIGDRVDIVPSATIQEFYGQVQLSNAGITVTSSGNAMPTPELLSAADASGVTANGYEGILAEVRNVIVTDIAPTPGGTEIAPTGEFEVDSSLRIDDLIYVTPFPASGAGFPSIVGVLAYRSGNQVLLPRDAGDVTLGDPTLVGFGPELSYIAQGLSDSPTGPVPLEVVLSHAPTTSTFVAVTAPNSNNVVVVGGGVTVNAGETNAIVFLDTIAVTASVTLSAALDGNIQTADVRVFDDSLIPELVSLSDATATPGNTATLILILDVPARVGGESVSLSLLPGTFGSVPASVLVAAGEVRAEVIFTANAAGTETVTATLGASSTSGSVEVSAGSLVINEVDYDQVDSDVAEFVEIYNGSGATISLSGLSLVFISGSNNAEYARVDLDAATSLAAGQYLVVGANSMLSSVPATELSIAFGEATNNIQNGSPDAVGLYDRNLDEMIDALSYEGSVTLGVLDGGGSFTFVEGAVLVAQDSNVEQGSLSRLPNGADTDDADSDWAFVSMPTPGSANQ